VFSKASFIAPAQPTLAKEPPVGALWLHEVKFDGYRMQIHKEGSQIALYSKTGNDFTRRFPAVAQAVAKLPTRAVILDAEVAAYDADGAPDFGSMLRKQEKQLVVWVFDILAHNGTDLRPLPLSKRRAKLDRLMDRVTGSLIRYSETFEDPLALLDRCAEHRLEGIVSKRIDKPYPSGPTQHWIKVKCAKWKEENGWRGDFFSKAVKRGKSAGG
jgi:bifunctional non-homologous end joining protein LigD